MRSSKGLKRKPTPIKNVHHQQHELKQESQKIQNKLSELKAQISLKKKQKEKNSKSSNFTNTKTSLLSQQTSASNSRHHNDQNVQKFLKNGTQNSKQSPSYNQQLCIEEVLKSLKIPDTVKLALNNRNIYTIDELLRTPQSGLDSWKEIPIGHRIKLKKLMAIAAFQRSRQTQSPQKLIEEPTHQQQKQFQDIEAIINRRGKDRIFLKIDREQQMEQQPEYQYEIERENIFEKPKNQQFLSEGQDEEDILIQSLNQAFFNKPRKSIMRKKSSVIDTPKKQPQIHKQVHWNKDVKQYDRSNKKVYKEISYNFQTADSENQIKETQGNKQLYCWLCLHKVQGKPKKEAQRVFCTEECMKHYQKITEMPDIEDSEQEQTDKLEVIDLSLL